MNNNSIPFFFKVEYRKTNRSVFIPHMYFTYMIARIFRSSGVKFDYTKGFNPRPKLRFVFPLSVGVSGENEIFFFYSYNKDFSLDDIRKKLPDGVFIDKVYEFENKKFSENNISSALFEFKLKKTYNYANCEMPLEVELINRTGNIFKIKFNYKKKAKFWDIMKYFSGAERFENVDYIKRIKLCEY